MVGWWRFPQERTNQHRIGCGGEREHSPRDRLGVRVTKVRKQLGIGSLPGTRTPFCLDSTIVELSDYPMLMLSCKQHHMTMRFFSFSTSPVVAILTAIGSDKPYKVYCTILWIIMRSSSQGGGFYTDIFFVR